jgi:hypothetical protein
MAGFRTAGLGNYSIDHFGGYWCAGGRFQGSWLGVLGWGYLYAGYLLFSRIEVGDMHARLKLVSQGWMGAAILVSIGGIVGVACWRLGVDNFLVHENICLIGEKERGLLPLFGIRMCWRI